MNRPRLVRVLRITWTALCGIAAVLPVVLWVRSLFFSDIVSGPLPRGCGVSFESSSSRLDIQLYYWHVPWGAQTYRLKELIAQRVEIPPLEGLGFVLYPRKNYCGLTLPFWFLVSVAMGATVILWVPSFKQFSLRTLLIAMTLVGVGLGIIAWLSR
jgi:hypothetical protein